MYELIIFIIANGRAVPHTFGMYPTEQQCHIAGRSERNRLLLEGYNGIFRPWDIMPTCHLADRPRRLQL